MASKVIRCRRCGTVSQVPLEAQMPYCTACHYPIFQNDYSNGGNVNFMFNNLHATSQGHAYGKPYQQIKSGMVYQPYPPPLSHGHKRAVLCGIIYKGHKQSLSGSVNDVMLMKTHLIERCGFTSASIIVLTEEERDYNRIPTRKNILGALRWLVQDCQPGDSLVFHYSGHGSQVRDRDGDELDGYDEALVPLDYKTEGKILDDELNATVVRPLPRGATLHAIIDTCFSGTFLDLPNVCRINRDGYYKWENHRVPRAAYRGTSGGYAISISACDDHQNSGDTTAFTGIPTGALTYSFLKTLEQQPRITYGHLLISMQKRINSGRSVAGLNSDEPHLWQEPQLSSSHKFDIHSKTFTL